MRVSEVRALIDELFDEQSREQLLRTKLRFPEGMRLDMQKLIVTGHSFGGMTAIETSHQEPSRVKACLTLDPWLYTMHQEILDRKDAYILTQPFQAVSTDKFHPTCENFFESTKTMTSLFDHSCLDDRQEHVIVKNTSHLHQCDMAAIAPIELFLLTKRKPQLTTIDTYILMSQLWLTFLDKINLKTPNIKFDDVDVFIKRMDPKWIEYDKKLEKGDGNSKKRDVN